MKRVSLLVLVIAVCTVGVGHAAVGLDGIGVRVGSVDPEGVSSTLNFGLILDLGTVAENVAIESYAGYWSKSTNFFGIESSLRDLMFGAKGRYLFTTNNAGIKPFLGAGLGLHVITAEYTFAPSFFGVPVPSETADETEMRPGFDMGGGVQFDKGGQYAFLAEAWYSAVSDASQLAFTVGLVYKFGR